MTNTELPASGVASSIIAEIATAFWVLRAPFAVALFASWILCSPDQVIELYVTLAQALLASDRATYLTGMGHVIMALFSLVILSAILWSIGRDLTLADPSTQSLVPMRTAEGAVLRNLPGVIGAAPLFAVAWGVYSASLKMATYSNYAVFLKQNPNLTLNSSQLNAIIDGLRGTVEPATQLSSYLLLGAWICFVLGLVFLIASVWRANTRLKKFERTTTRIVGSRSSLIVTFIVTGSLVTIFALQSGNAGGALKFNFTYIARYFGTIVLVNLFLICFAVFVSTMTRLYDKYWAPVLSLLLVVALVGSYLNSNDNHVIRTVDRPSAAGPSLRSAVSRNNSAQFDPAPYAGLGVPLLSKAFTDWMQNRHHRERFKGKPYPVYVVSAQGGGLYSANLAALTLARLYDRCPALKNHLFAASGVSGGGVGLGLISSLLRATSTAGGPEACNIAAPAAGGTGYYENRVKQFLAEDFLSPLSASALFPDVLQRFVPYPAIGAFDRARAFEASLEETWPTELSAANPLREGFLSSWSPSGPAPMLVLNATMVEDGRQVVVAPVAFGSNEFRSVFEPLIKVDLSSNAPVAHSQSGQSAANPTGCRWIGGQCLAPMIPETKDLPLSTALGVTARYPVVMPAATFDNNGLRHRLVDGGYFENSGIETAQSIVDALKSSSVCQPQPGSEDTCIVTDAKTGEKQVVQFHLIVMTEYYDPKVGEEGLNELLSPVRALYRTRTERSLLALQHAANSGVSVHKVYIDHDLFPLPLGWQFSSPTQGLIGAQIGDPAKCLESQDVELIELQLKQLQLAATTPAAKDKFNSIRKLVSLVNDNRCSLRDVIQGVMADQTASIP